MISIVKAAHRLLQEAIRLERATNPALVETDEENYSDSYKLLYLPIPDNGDQHYISHALANHEEFPDDCLAALLVEAVRNSTPIGNQVHSLCIDRVGSAYQFCISGSISAATLQQLCEQYQERRARQD